MQTTHNYFFSFEVKEHLQVSTKINTDLENIRSLSDEHNLNLNATKSKVICFASKNKRTYIKNNLDIKISNTSLQFTESAKNLGLIFDEDLRFTSYIKELVKKAFGSLKLIYNNRFILNSKLKKMLCESLVLSHVL